MALISKSFSLDMTPGVMPPVINVSEYDVNRQIIIFLQHNGGAFTPAAGTTAKIEGTLSNGFGFSEDADLSGNSVSFTLTESMTAAAGRAWVKVKLTNDGAPVSSCGFIMDVDRAGVEAGTVIGASGFEQQIVDAVDAWLEENAQNGIPPAVKTALLNCFENVAWIDEDGQDYYDALNAALNPQILDSISAVFTQGSAVVYDTDSLDSLKQYLVVTAHYTNQTTETLDSSAYTLSGTLEVGTSTITVSYEGKTTTFNVTVDTHYLYKLENYAFNQEYIDTEVQLLDTDKDFTIAFDADITSEPTSGDGSQVRYFCVFTTAGDGYSLSYGKGSSTASTYSAQWMGSYSNTVSTGAGRLRVVYTHSKNSGSVSVNCRKGTATANSYTVSKAFTASTRTLTLGKSTSGKLPVGTINKAYVLDYVMTSAEIDAFLGL